MHPNIALSNFRVGRLAAAVLTSALFLYGCGGAEDRQADYYQRAEKLFEEGDYEKARLEARNVLQINANHADARYLMARLEERERNWRGMFGNLNEALEIDPDHLEARVKLAQLLVAAGDMDKAEKEVAEVLQRDPANADAYAVRASIEQRRQNREGARAAAEKALEIDPTHVNAIGVIVGLDAEQYPDRVLALIEHAIESKPDMPVLKLLKIKVLGNEGEVAEAEEVFRGLIDNNPDTLYYVHQFTNFLIQNQRVDQAEALLRQTVDNHPDAAQPRIWLVEFLGKNSSAEKARKTLEGFAESSPEEYALQQALAELYLNSEEADKAVSVYRNVIARDPESSDAIDARNQLVKLYLRRNEPERAEPLLAEIFEIDSENAQALQAQARIRLSRGDVEGAIADLRAVLKNEPDSLDAVTLLAAAQERTGKSELALDYYQRALALAPENMTALMGAGRLLMAERDYGEAEKLLQSAHAQQPGSLNVVRQLNELYIRRQQWEQAREVAASLLLNQNTAAVGHYLQGRAHAAEGNSEAALATLKKALEKEPRAIEPLQLIARIHLGNDDVDKSVEFVAGHVRDYPEQPHARELLGGLYATRGNIPEAERTLRELIEDQPQAIGAYRRLGALYISQGDSERALELYRQGLEAIPENTNLMLALAEALQTRGEQGKALAVYEDLLETQPDSKVVKNNLAVLLMDYFPTEENLRRAQRLTADLASSDNPVYLDTVGWLQYKLGNYPQALALLQDAVRSGGKAPIYRYHLGMAMYKSDMKEQARQELQAALADDTPFDGRETAEETLRQL